MIDFDEKIYEFVQKFNGLYLRYSDDFIIVIPYSKDVNLNELKNFILNTVDKTIGIELQSDKTKLYKYINESIINISDDSNNFIDNIDYLSFTFDGKSVRLRPKTVTKYYCRMYHKVNQIINCNGKTKKGNIISCENLYMKYSQKGRNGKYDKSKLLKKVINKDINDKYRNSNFFTYVYRADSIFNPEGCEKIEPILLPMKRHMFKIRKRLKKIKFKN